MITIDAARVLVDTESDVADLLREFEEVNRYYGEVVDAMTVAQPSVAPVLNSAHVTLSFETVPTLDLFRNDD